MKSFLIILFCCNFITISLWAQVYQSAESVAYDPVNKQWLVANGNNIIIDDGNGNLSFFGSASAAYGMEVLNGVLFAIGNNLVRAYDLNTADELGSIAITGAGFLNGMTNDGISNLYVTDFSGQSIYKIDVSDISNMTFEEIVPNTGSTPNGIVHDGINNRLLFVNWGNNAPIKAVDLTNNEVSTVLSTNLGNIDGIDEDNQGNYYIASWSPDRITKYNPDFSSNPETITTPFINNPADIHYALESDSLGIPIGNDVVFVGIELDTITSTSKAFFNPNGLKIFPNPVTNQSFIQFELEQTENVTLDLLDLNGKVLKTLASGLHPPGEYRLLFAGHQLSKGTYICRFKRKNGTVTKKLVLVK